MAAAGLTAALGLALPAAAAQAGTSGYTPPPAEWWATSWSVPQHVWPVSEGAGATVAVIDSGVQASAPDLRGAVMSGADMLSPGGNGERDYAPDPGHGTFVAEMIAGQGIDGGPVGLAPRAKILPVHVNQPGPASPAAVPEGIRYAVAHGASVINLSLGVPFQSATYCDPDMQAAVSYALAHNVVVVASSGDTNLTGKGPIEPASCAGVLAVGGIEPNGRLWRDSTLEPYVSVAAPAGHILVGGATGQPGTGAGTSFASPLVAATAALIRSRYPKMPWYQVDQRIIATADNVPPAENNDYGFGYGYGIVNVAKAVNVPKYPVPASSPNPPYTRYAAWLNTINGQAWAKANGVAVPSFGGTDANPPSAARLLSSRVVIVGIVVAVVVLLVATAIALALRSRRKRRLPVVPDYPWTPGVPNAPSGPFTTPDAFGAPDAPSAFDPASAYPSPVPEPEPQEAPQPQSAQPQDPSGA